MNRIALLCALAAAACTSRDLQNKQVFTEPLTLAGKQVSEDVLNEGREHYLHFCYACHGVDGDGNGPAAKGLRPPPRDFRTGLFKFGRVPNGLPHDEDIKDIIRKGLHGTAMLEWNVPERILESIVQYIKTFKMPDAEMSRWQDPDEELGERIPVKKSPWKADQLDAAVERGKRIYHAFATCQQCHAAYATRQEIYDYSIDPSVKANKPITEFRPDLYQPEPKSKDILKVGNHVLKLLPPDFLVNRVRTGDTAADLYRTIAAGVPPIMPPWKGAMPDEDIWAIAHYVESLIAMRGNAAAAELRHKLATQPPFVAPPPPAPPEPTPPAPEPAKAAPAKPAPTEPAKPAPTTVPAKPAPAKPAPAKPAAPATDKPAAPKPATGVQPKPAAPKPAQPKPAQPKPAQPKPATKPPR